VNKAVSLELRNILTEIFIAFNENSFYLAGGTNLALKYAHRISTDIDLFLIDVENKNLESYYLPKLEQTFKERLMLKSIAKDALRLQIDDVKVDFLQWSTIKKILFDVENYQQTNWKLAHDLDVAAMKVSAIINRGTIKDFYDIALLLKYFSLDEIIKNYKEKYNVTSDNQIIEYMTDFHEADLEKASSIQLINFDLSTWQEVKDYIIDKVSLYLKEQNK
jgi:hypothetical protein